MENDTMQSENVVCYLDFRFGFVLLGYTLPPVFKVLVELIDDFDYFFNGLSRCLDRIKALVDLTLNFGECTHCSKQIRILTTGSVRQDGGKLDICIIVVLIWRSPKA